MFQDQLEEEFGGNFKFDRHEYIKKRYKIEGFEYDENADKVNDALSAESIFAEKAIDPGKNDAK